MKRKLTGLYFSPTGNTKKIVTKICAAMGGAHCTDFTQESQRKVSYTFGTGEAIVLGVPVYAGRVPQCAAEFLQRLKGDDTPAVIVLTYGNRDYDDALLELADMLAAAGFIPVAGGAFVGVHSYSLNVGKGRPDADDIEAAEELGRRAAAIIDEDLSGLTLKLKGNRPYREGMSANEMSPVTTDRCIRCRQCIAVCPVSAIEANPKVTDSLKCIMCQACVRACPVGARVVDSLEFAKTVKWLEANFSAERKSPQIFLPEQKCSLT